MPDPYLLGRKTEIRCSFPQENVMEATFRLYGKPADTRESWFRIDEAGLQSPNKK